MQALRHHEYFTSSLQRHGDIQVATTEEQRQANQDRVDQWAPPLNEVRPRATIPVNYTNTGSRGRDEYPQVEVTTDDIRQLIESCDKKAQEHRQGSELPEPYSYHGKTYRNKVKGSKVNASYSVEEIQEYVETLPPHRTEPEPFQPEDEIPFATAGDFVCTLRECNQ